MARTIRPDVTERSALTHFWAQYFRETPMCSHPECLTVASEGPYDTACFHVQQTTEKYLKGFLALQDQPIPRTHDLEELGSLCEKVEAIVELTGIDLAGLTGYAVELRYDTDFWPTRETAAEAFAVAERVRAIVLSRIPPEAKP